MGDSYKQKHFVLVHGACHGAWCWYKLKPLLQNAGYRVTALNMAASGINMKTIDQLQTLREYSEPLVQFIASLGDEEKVILVGHSLGGMPLSVAMELFPHKIEAAVYLTAFMPDTQHKASFVFDEFSVRTSKGDFWLDTEMKRLGDSEDSLKTLFFGPKFLQKLYHLSPTEDLELGLMLMRPSSLFEHDTRKAGTMFTKERYGSVPTIYVVCEEDQVLTKDFQLWMAENAGAKEIKELKGSDHMPMFCMPKQLCDCLVEIANK